MSALTNPRSSSARVVERWRSGEVDFVASKATLREAELVLGAGWLARVVGREPIEELLDELRTRSVLVEPVPLQLNLKIAATETWSRRRSPPGPTSS